MPRGFGRRGGGMSHERGTGRRGSGKSYGPGRPENCICPSCNTILSHQQGRPCFQIKCPNCGTYLVRQFVVPETFKRSMEGGPDVAPKIDIDLCTGCKKCMDVCPTRAISIINKKAVLSSDLCNGCRACVSVCPVEAIK